MVVPAAVILVVGGLCACAPLFKRVSQSLGRALSVLGFLVGIVVLIVVVDYALGFNFLSGSITDALAATSSPYLKYFLPAMILLGILLISRPIRNVRWASLSTSLPANRYRCRAGQYLLRNPILLRLASQSGLSVTKPVTRALSVAVAEFFCSFSRQL